MRTQPLRILPQHDERVADIAAVTAAAALARRRPLLTTVHKTDRALANNSRLPPRTHPECAACQRRNKAPRSPLHRIAMLSRAIFPPNRNGTTCPSPLEQDTIGNICLRQCGSLPSFSLTGRVPEVVYRILPAESGNTSTSIADHRK